MERVRKNGTRGKAAHVGRRLQRGSRRWRESGGGLKHFHEEIIKPRL